MGELIYRKGDVLQAKTDIVFHAVNILGKMGKGVALQIAKKWPRVKRLYLSKHDRGEWQLGELQICYIPDLPVNLYNKALERYRSIGTNSAWCGPRYVANLACQKTIGNRGLHVDYDALRTSFTKLVNFAEEFGYTILSGPMLGCGLGGGDPAIVEQIILDVIKDRPVTVEIYKL